VSGFDEMFTRALAESIELRRRLSPALTASMAAAGELLVTCYRNGGKAIFFGNGGSAADAQHLAAEMESRLNFDRAPLPALALHANGSTLTAIGNDYGYEQAFARPLRAHARPNDVAVAISTSGTSKNVVVAARVARELGIKLIALTGANTDVLGPLSDVIVAVPSRETARIQEMHIFLGHLLCQWVEDQLFQRARNPQPGSEPPANRSSRAPRPGLLLDRDGVINVEVDYLHRPEDAVLVPGAAEAIAAVNGWGIPVAVVTNQAGIGRGRYGEADYRAVTERLVAMLAAHGARVDGWFHCPHAPASGCACRKPAPGLLRQAAQALDLDLGGSVLVGDKISDLAAGRAAGCATILVRTGYGREVEGEIRAGAAVPPFDACCDSLAAALPDLRRRLQERGGV
jgi:D-sedoheptulose 7-phosphate isomerase